MIEKIYKNNKLQKKSFLHAWNRDLLKKKKIKKKEREKRKNAHKMLNHEIPPNTVRRYIQVEGKRVKSHELQKENTIPVLRPLSRMEFLKILGRIKIKLHC